VGPGHTVVLIAFGTGGEHSAIAAKQLEQNWKELYHEFGDKEFGIALQASTEGTNQVKVLEKLSTCRG